MSHLDSAGIIREDFVEAPTALLRGGNVKRRYEMHGKGHAGRGLVAAALGLPQLGQRLGHPQRFHRLGGVHVAFDVQVEVVALDLSQVGHVDEALYVPEGPVSLDDARDVLPVEEVLRPLGAVVSRLVRVHEQHLAAPPGGLVGVQDADGDGDVATKNRLGARRMTASNRSALRMPSRILSSAPPWNSTPWGMTTPTQPWALVTPSICSRKARSPWSWQGWLRSGRSGG